jgi:hypothetical protein
MQLDFMVFPYAPFRINLLARSLFACGLLIDFDRHLGR